MEAYLHGFIAARPRPPWLPPSPDGAPPAAFGLERLRELLERLGRPQDQLTVLHIAGTSGKTSTARWCEALFRAEGLSTGLHVSPHLDSVCERLTVDGAPCSAPELIALVQEARPIIDDLYRETELGMPSYFEVLLALALLHFARAGVDLVVLEAGLGGRFDGTNVVDRKALTLLTCVGLDHTHLLGDTKAEIALDKVQIARPGVPLLTAEQDPSVLAVIRDEVTRIGATLDESILGRLARSPDPDASAASQGPAFSYRSDDGRVEGLRCGAAGEHQIRNAGLALRALELLGPQLVEGFRSLNADEARRRGLAEVLAETRMPGRCELLRERPPVILDGAHNPDKLRALAAVLEARGGSWIGVLGMVPGRDITAALEVLAPHLSEVVLTRPLAEFRGDVEPRLLEQTWRELAPEIPSRVFLDPGDALEAALARAATSGAGVVATGSLYLVSALRRRAVVQALLEECHDE